MSLLKEELDRFASFHAETFHFPVGLGHYEVSSPPEASE